MTDPPPPQPDLPAHDPRELLRLIVEATRKLNADAASRIALPSRPPDDIYDVAWMRILASGYGANFEASWHSTWMMAGVTIALVADDQPRESYGRIPYVRVMAREELAETALRIWEQGTPDRIMNVHVQLGPDSGHAISLLDVDRLNDRVTYFDPVTIDRPDAPSLLCQGSNSIGVAAQPAANGADGWVITLAELRRCIVASYVKPSAYARLIGIDYKRTLQSVLDGDFGQFFNVRLLGDPAAGTHVEARLGAHEDEIHLTFETDSSGYVLRATIAVARAMLEAPDAILAIDALKSFIQAIVPSPDLDEAFWLGAAIWGIREGVEAVESTIDQGPAHLTRQVRVVWECLVGKREFGHLWLPLTTMAAANVNQEGQWWFRLVIALSELKAGFAFGPEDARIVEAPAS